MWHTRSQSLQWVRRCEDIQTVTIWYGNQFTIWASSLPMDQDHHCVSSNWGQEGMPLTSWEQKQDDEPWNWVGKTEAGSQLKTERKFNFRGWGCCFASLKRTGVVRYLWILPNIQIDSSHNSSSHRSTVVYRTRLSSLMSMQFCP